jgi:hypothetical protein
MHKKVANLLCIGLICVLIGCNLSSAGQAETLNNQAKSNTALKIVRHPPAIDYSFIHPGIMKKLPSYDPDSDQMWQLDLRCSNLSKLNLTNRLNDLLHADFDSKTKWPVKLPAKFNPKKIMESGKNPGLGIRELHKKGITGKGVSVAIIDQALLVDHIEYKDRLKMYEEIHCLDKQAQMHGPAVASIAVGKTVGAAPEAELYYIAETHGTYKQNDFEWDLSWLAKSIDRIVEVSKTLPADKKIRVISISLGINSTMNGYEKAMESIERAKKEGIYTVYVGSDPFMGLGRNPLNDPDRIASYTKGEYWKKYSISNAEQLLLPMDSRCTASPTGINDYVFYWDGGMSWVVPYVAGLYALACEVRPEMTPDTFWAEALKTSSTLYSDSSNNEKIGQVVNPAKLIESIQEMK